MAAVGAATAPVSQSTGAHDGDLRIRHLWLLPSDKPTSKGGKFWVDFQNDVTAADLELAVRENFRSVEHIKRYTTLGMATDQGKTSNINALGILSDVLGVTIPEIGTTTFRRPTPRPPSARLPDRNRATSSTSRASPPCTTGTRPTALCSRTWASGSAPGTTPAR